MLPNAILETHYHRTREAVHVSLTRHHSQARFDADCHARATAALAVAVDCMARINRRQAPAYGTRPVPNGDWCGTVNLRPRRASTVSQSIIPPLARHAVAAANACSAEMTCNGHAASLRAYDVARHYARILWPR